jgi:hypothetical protein
MEETCVQQPGDPSVTHLNSEPFSTLIFSPFFNHFSESLSICVSSQTHRVAFTTRTFIILSLFENIVTDW